MSPYDWSINPAIPDALHNGYRYGSIAFTFDFLTMWNIFGGHASLVDIMYFAMTLTFTNEVYTSRIKCSMRVNIKISKSSITPKMIFISHLQPLQISNKAKFHAFFEKCSHLKLKPAPTQDEFLNVLQNECSHSKCFQKAFFH